MNPERNCSVS